LEIIHFTLGKEGGLDNIVKKEIKYLNKFFNQTIFYFGSEGNKIYNFCKNKKISSLMLKADPILINIFPIIKKLMKSKIIHIHHTRPWILISPLFLFRKKTIYSFHVSFGSGIKKTILQKLIIASTINYVSLFSKKIICLTNGQKNHLAKYSLFKKKFKNKTIIINNFIESDTILNKKNKFNNKILFVGRYEKLKGIFDLLKITKKNKKLIFHFIGSGKTNINGKNVINYKKIDNSKILRYYDKCSIFILPSYTEAFPITILEAMSRGLVVLTSDLPGMKEIIKNGRNGYLFKPGDIDTINQKINYLRNNPEEIKKISQNNLIDIKKFTKEKQIKKFIKIYDEILRKND
jgi:glycosyltransferase involved in cell wall biosynthesis